MINIKNYIVATVKNWHINLFNKNFLNRIGWHLITSPSELTFNNLSKINPRYIFFPHWSWIVSDEVINNFECVCFHSSDVPYGRGGSPIQNLIIRGFQETKITALNMIKELDAGPVYLKKTLSLDGRAQDIYERSSVIIYEMIKEIANTEPKAQLQRGDPVVFKRRSGNDNILPKNGLLEELYNHIRMLDAESYPNSYIEHGDYNIRFSNAVLNSDYIEAKVRIAKK